MIAQKSFWRCLMTACLLLALNFTFAQQTQMTGKVSDNKNSTLGLVNGTVLDENGAPLPGGFIRVKGTTKGTVTDSNGKFSLDVPSNAILVISFLGYYSKEVSINGLTTLSIQLTPDSSELNEIVVVGYGIQKRADITGSISSVKSENFNRVW